MLEVQVILVGLALVAVFTAIVMTGPAGVEWRERRRLRLDRPRARVEYLPESRCRGAEADPDAVDFTDV